MAFSRISVAVIAIVAVGMLRVEQAHRIFITPAGAEVDRRAAAVCPETDDVPFSAACIKFIEDGVHPGSQTTPKGVTSRRTSGAESHESSDSHRPACPASNENGPYSAACIKFMSGWFWQADSDDGTSD